MALIHALFTRAHLCTVHGYAQLDAPAAAQVHLQALDRRRSGLADQRLRRRNGALPHWRRAACRHRQRQGYAAGLGHSCIASCPPGGRQGSAVPGAGPADLSADTARSRWQSEARDRGCGKRSRGGRTIAEGHFLGESEPYDAVILDIGLPKMDGISVLEAWRRAGRGMPVLILTARDRWSDKVQGFAAGADDYVATPFHLEEV